MNDDLNQPDERDFIASDGGATTGSVSELNSLLCCEDCGCDFTRKKAYLVQKRTDPLFKWTCAKCDECKEKMVNLAFKRLPEVMTAIAT